MERIGVGVLGRVLGLAFALGLGGAAGCARILDIGEGRYLVEAGPGTCEGRLHVRSFFDLTGSTRDVALPASTGCLDYLRELNARGGVRGCTVDVQTDDSRYDVGTALQIYQRWRTTPEWPNVSTVIGAGVAITQQIAPLTVDDGKVFMTSSYSGELASPRPVSHDLEIPIVNGSFAQANIPVQKRSQGYPTVFFPGTDYTTSARIAMHFAFKQSARRVAFFTCTTSAFCVDPVDGAKSTLTGLGIGVGRALAIELDEPPASTEAKVLAFFREEMEQKKRDPAYDVVDWIWFGNTRTTVAHLGKALARVRTELGVTVTVITNTWGVDEGLHGECGDACVGFLGVQPLPAYGDRSVPGMAELVRVHDKYRSIDGDPVDRHRTLSYVAGYVVGLLWERAVTAVVDAKQPVSGANLRAALESMRNLDLDGFARVSFTDADHRPQATGRIYRLIASGGLEPVGQPVAVPLPANALGW